MAVALLAVTFALLSMTGDPTPAPNPLTARCLPSGSQPAHDPILIVGDANFTAANGVRGGTGTPLDPYRVELWHILTGAGHGIQVKDTSSHFMIRNVLACGFYERPYPYDGIRLENVTNARVESFYSIYNGVHIRLINSRNIEVDQVGFNGDWGGYHRATPTITGIHVEDSQFVNISRVDTRWNGMLAVGVSLLRAWDVRIEDSNFELSSYAITFNVSHGVTIRRAVVGGSMGVLSVASSHVRIEDSSFIQCLGIQLLAARDVFLTRNTIINSGSGLTLQLAINVTVEGSAFLPPFWGKWVGFGIAAKDSADLLVVRNVFGAVCGGVHLASTRNATVHHNEFRDPLFPAYDDLGTENRWDDGYPNGGNYWSDYGGVDVMSGPNQDQVGNDGIGDTPYAIDANSLDRYPIYYARYEKYPWHPLLRGLSPLPPIRVASLGPVSLAVCPLIARPTV